MRQAASVSYLVAVCDRCGSTKWSFDITPKGDGTNYVKMTCQTCGNVGYDSKKIEELYKQKR